MFSLPQLGFHQILELRCRFAPLNKVKLNTLLANISDAEALLQKGR